MKIWESGYVKLLGVAIDNRLNFDSHIDYLFESQSKVDLVN